MGNLQANLVKYIKSPFAILAALIIMGILVNGYIFSRMVWPSLLENRSIKTQLAALEQQKSTLEKQPLPAKVTDSMIEELIRKVPLKEELAKFILSLKESEQLSSATIRSLSLGKETENLDPLAALQAGTSKTPTNNTQQTKPSTASAIEEIPLTLEISGAYGQVKEFLNRLNQLERLVKVNQWHLQYGNNSTEKKANESSAAVSNQVNVSMKLVIYSAKGFSDKFKDLPQLSVSDGANRLDPTWSDEQFRALMQSLNSK